jgi:hypothetical protein
MIYKAGHCLVDKTNIEGIALQAKVQRAEFIRKNPEVMLAMSGFAGLICALGLFFAPTEAGSRMENQSEVRTSIATAQIEKINTLLERENAIGSNPAHEIAQLIHQPIYDCNQVPCSSSLQRRNYLAKSKLEVILARKALPDEAEPDATPPGPKIVEPLK